MKKINFLWKTKIGIGVMTGTSCDAIDIAAVKFNNEIKDLSVFKTKSFQFPNEYKSLVEHLQNHKITVADISHFNYYYSKLITNALLDFIKDLDNTPDFIAVHGQTLWHSPTPLQFYGENVSSTFQSVNISYIAKQTNIPVVGDFRSGDIALGGQGAPLVPIFDYFKFASQETGHICVNIGGIANLTILPKNADIDETIAFDCGPGNGLIDIWSQKMFSVPYDKDGNLAKKGNFNSEFFGSLLKNDTFFSQQPPKSTGKDYYNINFITNALNKLTKEISPYDVINTLTHYSAYLISESIQKYSDPSFEIIISGGGSQNKFLIDCLQNYLPNYEINTSDVYGIHPNYKEAIAFAFLGYLFLNEQNGNIPSVTGARKKTILGTLAL